MEYDNTNQFAFFKQNPEDKKSEKAPDYKSNGRYALELSDELRAHVAAGGKLEIAGWKRTSAGGKQFLSCTVDKPYDGGSDF